MGQSLLSSINSSANFATTEGKLQFKVLRFTYTPLPWETQALSIFGQPCTVISSEVNSFCSARTGTRPDHVVFLVLLMPSSVGFTRPFTNMIAWSGLAVYHRSYLCLDRQTPETDTTLKPASLPFLAKSFQMGSNNAELGRAKL